MIAPARHGKGLLLLLLLFHTPLDSNPEFPHPLVRERERERSTSLLPFPGERKCVPAAPSSVFTGVRQPKGLGRARNPVSEGRENR